VLARKRVGAHDVLCCKHTNRRTVVEHQLWKGILTVLRSIDKRRKNSDETYSCEDIVRVWFWAVLHDRPVSWAIQRVNWPLHERRRELPSSSTMSRRLR